jgi:hypothetical protein
MGTFSKKYKVFSLFRKDLSLSVQVEMLYLYQCNVHPWHCARMLGTRKNNVALEWEHRVLFPLVSLVKATMKFLWC